MRTFLLLPGAGGAGWYWHAVADRLRAAGHEAVPVDLPAEDETAGIATYVDVARAALGERRGAVVVGQSLGGLTAAGLAADADVAALVFLNAMIPAEGEPAGDWWSRSGHHAAKQAADRAAGRGDTAFDPFHEFLHDLPDELVAEARAHDRPQSDAVFRLPWALHRWPDVPVAVLAGREDRFFPVDFQRGLARVRAGVEATVVPGGHLAALSRPDAVAAALLAAAPPTAVGDVPVGS